jgi:hypothetical protein
MHTHTHTRKHRQKQWHFLSITHTPKRHLNEKQIFERHGWTSAQALSPHVFTVNELFPHVQGDFFVPKWSDTSIVPPFAFVKGLCSNEQHGTQSVNWRFCFSLSLSLSLCNVYMDQNLAEQKSPARLQYGVPSHVNDTRRRTVPNIKSEVVSPARGFVAGAVA